MSSQHARNPASSVCVAPFVRRGGKLHRREVVVCASEDAAGRRGRRMLGQVSGMIFYRIECSADGDQWSEVIATVGDVPEED